MSRTKTSKVVLSATASDKTSDVIQCYDAYADTLFIGYKLTTSDVDLVSALTLRGNIEDDGAYSSWPALMSGAHVTVSDDSDDITYTDATGVLATLAGLPAGTFRGLIRIVNPPPFVVATFDYTSGGGTVALQLKAAY